MFAFASSFRSFLPQRLVILFDQLGVIGNNILVPAFNHRIMLALRQATPFCLGFADLLAEIGVYSAVTARRGIAAGGGCAATLRALVVGLLIAGLLAHLFAFALARLLISRLGDLSPRLLDQHIQIVDDLLLDRLSGLARIAVEGQSLSCSASPCPFRSA